MIPACITPAGRLRVRLTAPAGEIYIKGMRVGHIDGVGGFVYGVNGGVPVYYSAGIPLTALGQICVSNGVLKGVAPPSIPITVADNVKESIGAVPQLFNYGLGFLAAGDICTEVV